MQGFALDISPGPELDDEVVQNLTFVVSASNGADGLIEAGSLSIEHDGTLRFTLEEFQNGIATIAVYLKDSGGTDGGGIDQSAESVFEIKVNSVNNPPSFELLLRNVSVAQFSGLQSIPFLQNVSPGPANEADQNISF